MKNIFLLTALVLLTVQCDDDVNPPLSYFYDFSGNYKVNIHLEELEEFWNPDSNRMETIIATSDFLDTIEITQALNNSDTFYVMTYEYFNHDVPQVTQSRQDTLVLDYYYEDPAGSSITKKEGKFWFNTSGDSLLFRYNWEL